MVANTRPGPTDLVIDLAPDRVNDSITDDRVLFDGFLTQPRQAAMGLLLLARVARHRFYLPPGMVAAKIAASDPVVTASQDRLRFESFSACCGMALRYDVLPDGLDRAPARHGTTNIDLTGPTRVALSGIAGMDPLHVRISSEVDHAVTFTTIDHTATEARATLPKRWVSGFAEAQAAGANLVARAEVSVAQARRFWRTLPRTGNAASNFQLATDGRELRLTGTPTARTVQIGGPHRLRILEPLLQHATSLVVYGPRASAGSGVSLWQLNLPDGTVSCALSPSVSRGFSGEGGLLHQLADPAASGYAQTIADYLTDHHDGELLGAVGLATQLGLSVDQVDSGLTHLAASGTVGYDAAHSSYFHRQLPWATTEAENLNPRLIAARRLLETASFSTHCEGAVSTGEDTHGSGRGISDGDVVEIRHGDSCHRVRGQGISAICTCPWIAQHGSSRGPCKHILAANIFRRQKTSF